MTSIGILVHPWAIEISSNNDFCIKRPVIVETIHKFIKLYTEWTNLLYVTEYGTKSIIELFRINSIKVDQSRIITIPKIVTHYNSNKNTIYESTLEQIISVSWWVNDDPLIWYLNPFQAILLKILLYANHQDTNEDIAIAWFYRSACVNYLKDILNGQWLKRDLFALKKDALIQLFTDPVIMQNLESTYPKLSSLCTKESIEKAISLVYPNIVYDWVFDLDGK